MATEYEYWGQKFIEPDWEDEWEDISYHIDFDIPVVFDVEFYNGNWVDDESANDWESSDTWEGDFGEKITDPDEVYETIRDAIAEQLEGFNIPNGRYEISADVKFTINIDEIYMGKIEDNFEEINTDNIETKITNIEITNLKIGGFWGNGRI